MDSLYQIAGGLLASILAWVGVKLTTYINQKIKHEGLRNVLTWATDAAISAVKETAQVYAGALKDAAADGKLTPEESKEAMSQAMTALKRNLGVNGLAELERVLGHDSKGLESFLVGQLEAAVRDLKISNQSNASPKPTPTAAPPAASGGNDTQAVAADLKVGGESDGSQNTK